MTRTELLSLAERLRALALWSGHGEASDAADLCEKLAELRPVAWQWRKHDAPWSIDRTFSSEVFVTTVDSERRALYQLSEVLIDE